MPWRREWQPTPVLLPRESHWQRSLVGCSPWGHKESDVTERLNWIEHFIAVLLIFPGLFFSFLDPSQGTSLHVVAMSLSPPLGCARISDCPCFPGPSVLRRSRQVFCRMTLSLDLSDACLMIRMQLWFWGRNPEVKQPSHHVRSETRSHLAR